MTGRRLRIIANCVDDPRKIHSGTVFISEMAVVLCGDGAKFGGDTGRFERIECQTAVFDHQSSGEPGLVVAIDQARRYRAGNVDSPTRLIAFETYACLVAGREDAPE